MAWNKNIFNLFKFKKEVKEKDYYFGLILKKEDGVGLILEVDQVQKKIKIVDEKSFIFSNSWEELTDDIDQVLFELENRNKIRVEKVIFFLYSHLVDQKNYQIKEPYLTKIKRVVKELDLKPLGFIEPHEALSVYLTQKEETPLTSIIIEIDKLSLSVFVYKGGRIVFHQLVAKTDSLPSDIETAFEENKEKIILPSRMIIYNSQNLDKEVSKLFTYRWQEELFIQIPKVETISFEKIKEALVFSFSQQILTEEETKPLEEKKEEVMGFLIGKDIKEKKEPLLTSIEKPLIEKKEKKPFFFKFNFNLNLKFPPFSLALIGLGLLFFSFFVLFYFFHQASVTLYFPGKNLKKELEIKKDQLKITKLEKIVKEENSLQTTGKKIIGEKAKGEVTIFNSTPTEKEFKKGTNLETTNGIKFVLEENVKVASASQSLTSEGNVLTVTGKSKAKVIAFEIGVSGNISKEEKLKIADLPLNSVFAIPNQSFTGGSQQEIQTVSKSDMEKLRSLVLEKMKQKGISMIKKEIKDQQIIEDLTQLELISEKFSKELGEEAKNLSLKTEGKIIFFVFKKEDMKKIIINYLKNFLDSDYQLSEKNISFQLKKLDKEKESFIVYAWGKALVKRNKNELVREIKGKKLEQAGKIIKEKFKALGYEIKIKKNLPFLNQYLPFFEKNIQLRIESL